VTSLTILEELQKAVPLFRIEPDSLNENLTYLAINDFGRYICSEVVICSISVTIPRDELRTAMSFLEEALNAGDEDVRDLIFECLETIRDTLRTSDELGLVLEYLGPKGRDLWKRFRHA
jgi:hypothetical protein